jgi:hypothetical protein
VSEKEIELDPELLDLLIQSVSVLSNVATLATTWLIIRDRLGHPGGGGMDIDGLRQQIRTLRRGLEDTFESLEAALRVLEEARLRAGQPSPLAQPTRFGFGVMLMPDELGRINQHLNQLDSSAIQARNIARNLHFMMNAQNMASTFNVTFDPNALNQQLNSILFESSDLGEAMTKLRLAQQQAEDFVSELERALRRN